MAQMAQSLADWPTIEEAAAQLNTSVRTMWRHAEARRVEMRKRPRPGKKPENVCNPRDVEKLMPAAHVMPPEKAGAETGLARRVQNGAPHPWQGALERIATILSAQQDGRIDTIGPTQQLWLSLKEASTLAGLSRKYLLRACEEGRLESVRDGRRRRIRRASLEAFAG